MSNRITNRINFGMTGDAKCHATDGWFCAVFDGWREIVKFVLYIQKSFKLDIER